jgi:DNA-binding NarL/FixJ family response regulator
MIDNDASSASLGQRLREAGFVLSTVCEASAGLRQLKECHYDAILVNPALFPRSTCPGIIQQLRSRTSTRTAILFLTAVGCLEYCRACSLLGSGSMDCVDIPADPGDIIARLRYLLRHETARPPRPLAASPLSPREREVLGLARYGLSNREIAARLFITEKVVEKHLARLCSKLGVANRTTAVALSYRKSLLAIGEISPGA